MEEVPSATGSDSPESFQPPPGFDVFDQTFTLHAIDGTGVETSTVDVDAVRLTAVRAAIVFATQLGASAILLLVLLLMTTASKRRSLAYVFNVLALICNVIRCTIQCIEMTGPFLNFVVVMMADYSIAGLDKHVRMSVANAVIATLVFVFIELALIVQVHVVCLAMFRPYRTFILTSCGVVAAIAVSFRINVMIINAEMIANLASSTPELQDKLTWAQRTANITSIVSICFFSLIFCTKLGVAIVSRRNLGLKQFGAMQIIFIMGCQTLFIPLIFAILDYYAIRGAQLGSYVETLVAIFLPLSSMWASTNINSKHVAMPMNNHPGGHRAIPVGHTDYTTGGGDDTTGKRTAFMVSDDDTLVNRTPSSSYAKKSPTKQEPRVEIKPSSSAGGQQHLSFLSDSDDLEMQKLGNSIQVDKSYSVSSEPDWMVGRAR